MTEIKLVCFWCGGFHSLDTVAKNAANQKTKELTKWGYEFCPACKYLQESGVFIIGYSLKAVFSEQISMDPMDESCYPTGKYVVLTNAAFTSFAKGTGITNLIITQAIEAGYALLPDSKFDSFAEEFLKFTGESSDAGNGSTPG